MRKRTRQLAKGLAIGTLVVAYQMPGCNLGLNGSSLQSLFDSLNGLPNLNVEISTGMDGGEDRGGDDRGGNSGSDGGQSTDDSQSSGSGQNSDGSSGQSDDN